jgi:hypothetical protein
MALQPGLFNITSATTTTILEKDTRGSWIKTNNRNCCVYN